MNDYSSRFKEIRKKLDLNQKGLADALNTTQPNVSAIEKGKRKPTLEMLEKLIELGVTSHYLLYGDKPILESEEPYYDGSNKPTKEDYKFNKDHFLATKITKETPELVDLENNFYFLFAVLENFLDYLKQLEIVFDYEPIRVVGNYKSKNISDIEDVKKEIFKNLNPEKTNQIIDTLIKNIAISIKDLNEIIPTESIKGGFDIELIDLILDKLNEEVKPKNL